MAEDIQLFVIACGPWRPIRRAAWRIWRNEAVAVFFSADSPEELIDLPRLIADRLQISLCIELQASRGLKAEGGHYRIEVEVRQANDQGLAGVELISPVLKEKTPRWPWAAGVVPALAALLPAWVRRRP